MKKEHNLDLVNIIIFLQGESDTHLNAHKHYFNK